jgi:hypothetical protein
MQRCFIALGQWTNASNSQRPIPDDIFVEEALMEYRVEMINFGDEENRLEYLVRRLNEFGKDGWRVVSVDLTAHPAFKAGPLPVLLERNTGAKAKNAA